MSRLTPRTTHVLVIIKNQCSLLLGVRKEGFGKDKCSGFGGIIDFYETPTKAALRHVEEQCGLIPNGLTKLGAIELEFRGQTEIMHTHIFSCESYTGDLIETAVMSSQWYKNEDLPFDTMWPDHKVWLPDFLIGVTFHGFFRYDENDFLIKKIYTHIEIPPTLDYLIIRD